MVGRSRSPSDLVAKLRDESAESRLKAIRDVKNQIIGNKSRKNAFIKLGCVPRVVELLASPDAECGVRIQCAQTMGSFAYGLDDGLRAVLDSGGVTQLLQTLSSPDERVVEAGVRALKMVYKSPLALQTQVLGEDALRRLVGLLSSHNRNVAEVAATVLARGCATPEQQAVVAAAGGLAGLLGLLSTDEQPRQEAAVDALAALTADNAQLVQLLAASSEAVARLSALLKASSPATRFLAAKCLTQLAPALPSTSTQSYEHVRRAVLPVLAKLLGKPGAVHEEAPQLLAQLVEGSPALQAAAADADAIANLAGFLPQEGCSVRLKVGTLRALSTLCAEREASRKQVVDAGAMPHIVRALDHASPEVRAAACLCVRSLSRSVKSLRSSLIDADVAEPLFRRLGDSDPQVQATASATLCNIVLDFSPMKDAVLACGCLGALVRLTSSPEGELRLNATWALQNLVYQADADVRSALLRALTWQQALALANDIRSDVQERALNLLRNQTAHCYEPELRKVLDWAGGELLPLMVARVDPAASHPAGHRIQALYTLVNVAASGAEAGRDAIMAAGLAPLLPDILQHGDEDAKEAAVWCVINLTTSGAEHPGAVKRVAALREAGVGAILANMQNETEVLSKNVVERVRTALDNLAALDMFTE